MNSAETLNLDPNFSGITLEKVPSNSHDCAKEDNRPLDIIDVPFEDRESVYPSSSAPICKYSADENLEQSRAHTYGGSVDYSLKLSRLTPAQLEVLEKFFADNLKVGPKIRKDIVKQTGMTEKVIQYWFQNKRAKLKAISVKRKASRSPTNASTKRKSPRSDYYFSSFSHIDCDNKRVENDVEHSLMPLPQAPDFNFLQTRDDIQSSTDLKFSSFSDSLFNNHGTTLLSTENTLSPKFLDDFPIPDPTPTLSSPTNITISWNQANKFFHEDKEHTASFDYNYPSKLSPRNISSAESDFNKEAENLPNIALIKPISYTFFNTPNRTIASLPVLLPPITFPLTSVCIGTWKRNVTLDTSLEHMFYFSPSESTMVYIFFVNRIGFKISYPKSAIESVQLTASDSCTEIYAQTMGKLEIRLRNRPSFFIQPFLGSSTWKSSSDFTENKQASYNLQHYLYGPFYLLKIRLVKFLSSVAANNLNSSEWTSFSAPTILSPDNNDKNSRKYSGSLPSLV